MVLIQYADVRGFVFFTNLDSRKAHELASQPGRRALRLLADARPAGPHRRRGRARRRRGGRRVLRVAPARESDRRLGVAAERDARSRAELEARVRGRSTRPFRGRARAAAAVLVGLSSSCPIAIEFWSGRAGRLHHRELFERDGAAWRTRAAVSMTHAGRYDRTDAVDPVNRTDRPSGEGLPNPSASSRAGDGAGTDTDDAGAGRRVGSRPARRSALAAARAPARSSRAMRDFIRGFRVPALRRPVRDDLRLGAISARRIRYYAIAREVGRRVSRPRLHRA